MPNTNNDYLGPINANDKETLHGAGVDVSDTPLEKEEGDGSVPSSEEKIVDIDGTTPVAGDADVKNTGIRFVENEPQQPNKEDLSSLAEQKFASKDLEAQFRSELSDVKEASSTETEKQIYQKSETLSALLERIQKKLYAKKTGVKDELSSLKKMKDVISNDIAEIKELEESEKKIKDEVGKIESIKKEVELIEEELGNEKV